MDQISGTTPSGAPAQTQQDSGQQVEEGPQATGFGSRGKARRRLRFLRKARELAYRDLGGLVFDLHRFGQRNDALVLAKLNRLGVIDAELRALEAHLREPQPVTVLREAGVTACARCAAIHGSEDRFCPNCGLAISRHADLPIGGAPASPAAESPPPAAAPAPATPPAAAPASAAAPSATAASAAAVSAAAVSSAPATPAPIASPAPPPAQPAPAAAPPGPAPSPPPPPGPAEAQPAAAPQPAPAPERAGPADTAEEPTEIVRPLPHGP